MTHSIVDTEGTLASELNSQGYRLPSEHGEFMEPEVTGPELWLLIDGSFGGVCYPLDCTSFSINETEADGTLGLLYADDLEVCELAQIKALYSGEVYSIEIVRKCGARLSASGYMDCTDWVLCDTEAKAEAELKSMHPESFLVEVYWLRFIAHSGIETISRVFGEGEQNRARAWLARRVRRARKDGYRVSVTAYADHNKVSYEFEEPEASAIQSDASGIATLHTLQAYPTY